MLCTTNMVRYSRLSRSVGETILRTVSVTSRILRNPDWTLPVRCLWRGREPSSNGVCGATNIALSPFPWRQDSCRQRFFLVYLLLACIWECSGANTAPDVDLGLQQVP